MEYFKFEVECEANVRVHAVWDWAEELEDLLAVVPVVVDLVADQAGEVPQAVCAIVAVPLALLPQNCVNLLVPETQNKIRRQTDIRHTIIIVIGSVVGFAIVSSLLLHPFAASFASMCVCVCVSSIDDCQFSGDGDEVGGKVEA